MLLIVTGYKSSTAGKMNDNLKKQPEKPGVIDSKGERQGGTK
jgi:hypothetical protein